METIKLKKITKSEKPKAEFKDVAPMDFPTLYVDDGQIPEIVDWDVNETYRVVVELKQKSKSSMSVGGGAERVDARFDIVAYKVITEKRNKDDISEDEIAEGLKSK